MRITLALMAAVLAAAAIPAAAFQDRKPDLAAVAFMEGYWRDASKEGSLGEEVWTAPVGDSMLGTAREVVGGKTVFYELAVIQQTERGLVLRLKLFDEGIIGREDKDKTTDIPVVRTAPNEVVFESDDKERLTRLTYKRTGAETMSVLVERHRNGKELKEEFLYRLKK